MVRYFSASVPFILLVSGEKSSGYSVTMVRHSFLDAEESMKLEPTWLALTSKKTLGKRKMMPVLMHSVINRQMRPNPISKRYLANRMRKGLYSSPIVSSLILEASCHLHSPQETGRELNDPPRNLSSAYQPSQGEKPNKSCRHEGNGG